MHLSDSTINIRAGLTFAMMSGVFVFWAADQAKDRLFEKVKSLVPELSTEWGGLRAPKILSTLKAKPEAKKLAINFISVFGLVYFFQLFDFALINGVYGHLLGAALAGIVLGPALGLLNLSAILLVQAFSGDGGIMALGANIFTMAVVGAAGGYYLFAFGKKFLPAGFSIIFATFLSVIFSALAFGLILLISRKISAPELFSVILLPHVLVGLAESIVTLIAVKFFLKAESYRP